jgi:hypothetical protein
MLCSVLQSASRIERKLRRASYPEDCHFIGGTIHVYKQARLDCRVTLIPGDYVTDNLIDLLRSNDFDFDAATYFT